MQQVKRYIKQGLHQVVDVDLSQFFDTVSHDVLMSRVSRKINDKRLLKLIGRYLRTGVMIDGQCYPTRVGMPQGGPLSPLMSNVLLDDLDKELEYRGHCFARYCDDFVILVGSQRSGERVMDSITRYLERRLKLTVNPTKSKVVKATKAEFLSFTFTGKKNPVDREEPALLQAASPLTHQPQLGCINELPFAKAYRIYQGLDGLLQNNRILPSYIATGSIDTSAYSLLFYQAVA